MKCIIHIEGTNISETTTVSETLKVGNTHNHNGVEYTVKEIVIEPNQDMPIIYCSKSKDKKSKLLGSKPRDRI